MKYLYLIIALTLFAVPAFPQEKIEVVEGSPTPAPMSTVRGRIFYADTSRPVRRATIMLMKDTISGPGEKSGLTDNEGNFEISGVSAGTYYAMVNAPGVVSPLAFVDFSQMRGRGGEREAMAEAFKDFEKIIVNGINDTYVQVAARRGGAISGRISYDDGDSAIGVKVEVLRKVGDKFLGVLPNFSAIAGLFGGGGFQTDDRGMFRFSGLPPGEYIVRAVENANHTGNDQRGPAFERMLLGGGSSFLTVYNPDVFDPDSADVIKIDYGIEMTDVNVTIPGRFLYAISGRVISAKDKTPVAAEITLQRDGDNKTFTIMAEIGRQLQGTRTNSDGKWLFVELPKGKYKVVVSPTNLTPDDFEEDEEGLVRPRKQANKPQPPKYAKKIEEITIDDKNVADIQIELTFGGILSGTVAVENTLNEMPESVSIRVENETAELGSAGQVYNYSVPRPGPAVTVPKIDRDFKIDSVSAGKSKFTVVPVGDYYVKSMMAGSVDLLSSEYEFKEGERLENVRIVLGKGLGKLTGKVTTDGREPAPGVQIMAVPVDPKRRTMTFQRNGRTDENGDFEIKLAPGEFAIILVTREQSALKGEAADKWLEAAIKDASKVKIESGKSETINMKMPAP